MILAFGDSLTNGFGVGHSGSYPRVLEQKTGLKVINAGVDGEFSHAGLQRLPKLLELQPDLVILCHGANDILTQMSTQRLKQNLLSMVKLIQESGIKILLIAVPDYYTLGYEVHELYREVADEMSVLIEDEVLQKITLDDSLKNDDVHPNEKGYALMADTFLVKLQHKSLH